MGLPFGGFPDLGYQYLDPYRPQAPYQLFGTSSLTPLGYSASGRQVMIATDNTTVVSYISTNNEGLIPPVTSSSGSLYVLRT